MKILTNYDFSQNQLMNAVIQKLAAAPVGPVSGQVYYDTVKERLFSYNGTKWVGADATDAIMTAEGIVALINGSAYLIDDDNLSPAAKAAIAASHTSHSIANITGLQTALDGKVDDSQVLTNVPVGALFTDTITSINGKTGVIAKADITALGIPAQDTVYTHPITTGNKHIPAGGASGQFLKYSADGTAIWAADNNTVYTHPTADGDKHVPATGTTNDGKVLKAGSTAGTFTWATDNDTITTVNGNTGAITKADVVALGVPAQDTTYGLFNSTTNGLVPLSGAGATKYLRQDGAWIVPTNTNTTYTAGAGLTLTTGAFAPTWGTLVNTVPHGNDVRFSDARTPLSHAIAGAEHSASTLAQLNAKISDATLIDTGDTRLSNARTPLSHVHGSISNTGAIGTTADLIVQTGASGVLGAKTAGTASQFLNGLGAWATPPDNNTIYTHPTGAGSNHIPTGGTIGQILKNTASGTATWQAEYSYTHPTHVITDITGLETALDGKVDDSQVLTNVPVSALFTDTVTTVNGKTGVIVKADVVALGIPAQDTTYGTFTTSVNGLVPKTTTSNTADYLRRDGSWATPPNTIYSLPVAGATIGGVKTGTDISIDASGNVSVVDDSHNHVIGNVDNLQTALDAKETPAGATAKASTAENNAKSYTDTKLAELVDSSPATLDTLNELAAALGNDPNFATTMTNTLAQKTNKYSTTVGNAALTTIVITHNLNSRDVMVQLRETASPYAMVITDIEMTTVNTITLKFAVAPALNAYTVTVIG